MPRSLLQDRVSSFPVPVKQTSAAQTAADSIGAFGLICGLLLPSRRTGGRGYGYLTDLASLNYSSCENERFIQ